LLLEIVESIVEKRERERDSKRERESESEREKENMIQQEELFRKVEIKLFRWALRREAEEDYQDIFNIKHYNCL